LSHSPTLPEGSSIYLAGPMTGYASFNFPAFQIAADWLRLKGHTVWSPHEHDLANGFDPEKDEALPFIEYMRHDLPRVMQSDAVVTLRGWSRSKGAMLETRVAQECGIPIYGFRTLTLIHDLAQRHKPLIRAEVWDRLLLERELEVGAAKSKQPAAEPRTWGMRLNPPELVFPPPTTSEQAAQRIVTNAVTGGQKETRPARFDLLPWDQLWRVAELYAYGATKYEDHNWAKGYDFSLSIAALERHMARFTLGEDLDEESHQPHLASVVFHALALMRFEQEIKAGRMPADLDNRFKILPTPTARDRYWADITAWEQAA